MILYEELLELGYGGFCHFVWAFQRGRVLTKGITDKEVVFLVECEEVGSNFFPWSIWDVSCHHG